MANIKSIHSVAIYRLTALWAFIEVGLGGLLHAMKIPVSGFVVGAMAVTILCLIANLSNDPKKEIIKALIVVLLIKITVTPHAGIGAYIAVGFQGLTAILLFSFLKFEIGAILLGLLAMAESASQKIIMLYVLYGKSIVEGFDTLAHWITNSFGIDSGNASKNLVLTYISIYSIWGVIVGFLSIMLAKRIKNRSSIDRYVVMIKEGPDFDSEKSSKRVNRLWVVGIILISLLAYLLLTGRTTGALFLVVRLFFIMLLLYKVVSPLLTALLKRYLNSKKSLHLEYMNEVLSGIPYAATLSKLAWIENSKKPFFVKLKGFILDTILYNLHYIPSDDD